MQQIPDVPNIVVHRPGSSRTDGDSNNGAFQPLRKTITNPNDLDQFEKDNGNNSNSKLSLRSKLTIEKKNYKSSKPKNNEESQTNYIYNMWMNLFPSTSFSLMNSMGSQNLSQLGSADYSDQNKLLQDLQNQNSDMTSQRSLLKNFQTIPFIIGFKPDYSKTYQILINDYLIMVIYLIDILIKFASTYFDSHTGEEFFDPKKVAILRFRKFRFYLDLLAFIPFSKIFADVMTYDQQNFVSTIRMLKLYKLAIFTKLIQKLSVSKSAKASLKVLFLIFFLIFFLHFQTCIIFYLAQIEKVWIPNCDFIYKGTKIYDLPINNQYWVVMYYSAMLFSISDMLAATAAELAFNAIMMVLCMMIVANVFGLMASFVSQMNEKDQKFSQQMDIVNTAISNLHLSEELKREIAYYMVQMQGTQEQQEEFQSFIEDIRPGLKKQIQREIFMIAIKKNELMQIMFSTKPQYLKMLEHIVDNLEVTMREPENEIIKQGSDECEFMYFVQKGKCNVVVQDKIGLDSGSKRVRQLYPGDHFGEVGLIYNCRRTASVVAGNYCTLGQMSGQNFKLITMKYPQLLQEMKEQIYAYDDDVKVFMETNLKKIDYMKKLDHDIFHEILFNFQQETFERDTILSVEKEKVKKMFIIKNGIVEITVKVDGVQLQIERLYRGSILNHRAFLVGDVSDIKASCTQTQTLFFLTYDQFQKLCMKNANLEQEIKAIRDSVKGKENPYFIDYIHCRSVVDQQIKRNSKLEERRSKLTCQLKNAVLVKLSNLKKQRSKLTFKEVINKVIQMKKEEMKKQRKKKLKQLMGENDDDNVEFNFEDLSPEQASVLMELMEVMQEKYQANNLKMASADKVSLEIQDKFKLGINLHNLYTPKNIHNLRPNTPKFSV
eukprot:403377514